MGKSSKPKIEVTEYFMSQHFGICIAADAIKRIVIKEKDAWTGNVTTMTPIEINKDDLFGGVKKEGGVEGVVYFLPGASDQILPDQLAVRLGRANGADCPGFRGICTAFFVGENGLGSSGSGGLGGLLDKLGGGSTGGGFYWSANSPYLPGVWIEVERAPRGLNPDFAMIPRLGSGSVISDEGIVDLDAVTNAATTDAGGLLVGVTLSGFATDDILQLSLPPGETYAAWSPWGDPSPVSSTPPKSGSVTRFNVIPDGNAAEAFAVGTFGTYDGYEAARAAFTPVQITGATEYTFFIYDSPIVDNSGGLSIHVERIGAPKPDANPAHIIYECLTNTDWGMGSPSTAIDVDSFDAASATLYAESFGLSMIWTRQASIQKFIQEVLDHIQGVLFVDPRTGLLTLKLIRDDYVEEDLPVLTPQNASLSNFGRKLWGEIVNEIVVTWTNPGNEQDETVTVQDLASIVTQGGIISDGRNYYGVRTAILAQRLAARDLRTSGAPLAACEAEVNRELWFLRPASVVKVDWPEDGFDGVIMRVVNVNYGKPGDMTLKLSLLEDVFGVDTGDYIEPPSTGWEDPSTPPEPLDVEIIFTLPLFFAAATETSNFIDDPTYPEVLAGVLVTASNDDTLEVELWDEVTLPDSSLQWENLATCNVIGRAELADGVPAEATTIIEDLDNFTGQTGPTQGGFVIIGDGDEEDSEIALITDVGEDVTIARGVLDTVPRAWPAGTPVWFVDRDTSFEDPTVRSAGEAVSYKFLPRTSQGLLPLADASLVSYTLTERPWLPNRPAAVTAYGADFNTVDSPVDAIARPDPWVTVDWANRNRLLEDSQVLSWTDATVDPEDGQTTTILVMTSDGATTLDTHDALTGTTFDVPDSSFGGETVVLIRVSSERTDADGTFASLQWHDIWVQVASGSRATEEGDARLTEEGDTRGMED